MTRQDSENRRSLISFAFCEKYATVLPGCHMNMLYWISLSLMGHAPESVCKACNFCEFGGPCEHTYHIKVIGWHNGKACLLLELMVTQ